MKSEILASAIGCNRDQAKKLTRTCRVDIDKYADTELVEILVDMINYVRNTDLDADMSELKRKYQHAVNELKYIELNVAKSELLNRTDVEWLWGRQQAILVNNIEALSAQLKKSLGIVDQRKMQVLDETIINLRNKVAEQILKLTEEYSDKNEVVDEKIDKTKSNKEFMEKKGIKPRRAYKKRQKVTDSDSE